MTSDGCSDAGELEEKMGATPLLPEGVSLVLTLAAWFRKL